MSDSKRPTLIMIDGHAVAYRQFFALPLETFSTRDGEPTNATFGFARTLLDVLEKDQPKYLLVTFDMGLSGRDELYGDYKGTREKMPDELRVQIERIHALVEAFNIPILEVPGYEADDVLGSLAHQAEAQDVDVLIVTGDRDLLQLVTEHINVRLPPGRWTKSDQVFGPAEFSEKYDGLQPPQLVDLKALMGDSSDNIPGVKGIGEKGAIKLIQQYGSLEGVYDHLDELSKGQRTKLEEGRDLAFLSKQLATIKTDAPVKLDLPACVAHDYDRNHVADLFRLLEFRLLADRIPSSGTPAVAPGEARQMNMFGASPAAQEIARKSDERSVVETTLVQDEAGLQALVKALQKASVIAFDTETTGIDQMQAELVGIALAVEPERRLLRPGRALGRRTGSPAGRRRNQAAPFTNRGRCPARTTDRSGHRQGRPQRQVRPGHAAPLWDRRGPDHVRHHDRGVAERSRQPQ